MSRIMSLEGKVFKQNAILIDVVVRNLKTPLNLFAHIQHPFHFFKSRTTVLPTIVCSLDISPGAITPMLFRKETLIYCLFFLPSYLFMLPSKTSTVQPPTNSTFFSLCSTVNWNNKTRSGKSSIEKGGILQSIYLFCIFLQGFGTFFKDGSRGLRF